MTSATSSTDHRPDHDEIAGAGGDGVHYLTSTATDAWTVAAKAAHFAELTAASRARRARMDAQDRAGLSFGETSSDALYDF